MAAPNARILLVDDIEDIRHQLSRHLMREGYTDITEAADGETALALIATQPFDLVLLDVTLPICDSYQVLERMKAAGQLAELPVIVISALDEIDSIVRCIELGAVDYLTKPFNATLLRARVTTCLEQQALRNAMRAHMEQMETELEAARILQVSMMPSLFPPPSPENPVEIFALMDPAREVGGDFYDFFSTADGRFAFAIADVSGKGVPGAIFMARTKNLLRVLTSLMQHPGGGPPTPSDIVGEINRELCAENDTMMFVTLIFGILDPRTGDVRFCNAGHDPPYRLSRSGATPVAGTHGMALGIDPDWSYETTAIELLPGEALFLFTDGIAEAANAANELFTKARLEKTLNELTHAPLDQLTRAIMQAIQEFVQGAAQFDDITSLAVRRLGV